nr:nucleotide disphospho-sugar-binding domain-containing protein [Massilia agri]
MPAALATCELVVCHAGEATTAQALLAGRPLLMLPVSAESYLMARRVAEIGAGINASGPQDWDGFVRDLLQAPGYRDAAGAFARRHAGFDAARRAEALADRFEEMVRRR